MKITLGATVKLQAATVPAAGIRLCLSNQREQTRRVHLQKQDRGRKNVPEGRGRVPRRGAGLCTCLEGARVPLRCSRALVPPLR